MPAVPLGLKAYKRADGFVPEVRLRNMYLEKDDSGLSPDQTMRIERPGLVRSRTLAENIRGLEQRLITDAQMAVGGARLYVDGVDAGAIDGNGMTPMVDTPFSFAIVGGSTVYLYDTALTIVAMPDGRSVVDVDQLNGYILLACEDGRFYWIVPGETTVDPLNFATAEFSADKLKAVRRVGDEFWLFGEVTVEPWQATGDLDAPFQRVTGRIYERGCLARDSVRRFDNSVMWVSDDAQVCRGGAVPTVVSDNAIAERIRKRTAEPSAWTFAWDGHDFYVLRIPGQGTFAYDASTQSWCEFSTLGLGVWAPWVGYTFNGEVYAGDSATGAIWRLDGSAGDDDGVAIECILTATVGFMGNSGRNDSLAVGVGASANTTVRLRYKDGQEDYPSYYDEMPVYAPTDVANWHRLGKPLQPYRSVEISHVGSARIRIAGATFNEAWR